MISFRKKNNPYKLQIKSSPPTIAMMDRHCASDPIVEKSKSEQMAKTVYKLAPYFGDKVMAAFLPAAKKPINVVYPSRNIKKGQIIFT